MFSFCKLLTLKTIRPHHVLFSSFSSFIMPCLPVLSFLCPDASAMQYILENIVQAYVCKLYNIFSSTWMSSLVCWLAGWLVALYNFLSAICFFPCRNGIYCYYTLLPRSLSIQSNQTLSPTLYTVHYCLLAHTTRRISSWCFWDGNDCERGDRPSWMSNALHTLYVLCTEFTIESSLLCKVSLAQLHTF